MTPSLWVSTAYGVGFSRSLRPVMRFRVVVIVCVSKTQRREGALTEGVYGGGGGK